MKKIKSLLALLLLGGMVLSGCGDKDKGGNSGDSGTPSQQGGSGDQGGSGNGDSSGGGNQGGGDQGGGGNQGGGETIVASWPSTTVQMYLDLLGVEHDRVPSIQNDAITSYAITSDATAVQTEQGFTIACVGGGSLLNSYIDTLLANGYTYRENVGCYMTSLGEVCIGLDVIEGNLVIVVMLPNAGGGGSGEQQQDSRFVGKRLTIADAKDQYGQPLDNETRNSILNEYGNAWISLFDNSKFEMVQPIVSSYDVIKGVFEVTNNDTTCVLTTTKIFDGEHQVYSYVIPTEMASFTIQYSLNTQQYSVIMSKETGVDEYIFFTLILQVDGTDLEPVNIPDDPNGDSFDPRYQVTEAQWNEYFNSDGGFVQKRIKATNVIKSGNEIVGYDVWDFQGGNAHYESDTGVEFYYHIKSEIRNEQNELEAFSTDTYTSNGAGGWNKADGALDYKYLIHEIGLFAFDISSFSFSNFESTHYYVKSSLFVPCTYDHNHNLTNVKISFSNGNLTKIEYTETNQPYEFNFTQHGTATVVLPDVGGGGGVVPQPVSWPTSQVNSYLAALGATNDTLPAAHNSDVTAYEFNPVNAANVTDNFTITCVGGAALESSYAGILTSNGFTFDSGEGFYISPNEQFCVYSYAQSSNFIIDVGAYNNGGGGDPQPAVWPADWVAALYSAWGITNDIIPECGTTNVTSFATNPSTPSDSIFYALIAANGGADLYDSYIAALGVAGYVPNAFGYYVSANKELMILPQVTEGALSIMIFPYDSSLEINDASLIYSVGYSTHTTPLLYDSAKDEYYIKGFTLYEEYEFFLYIPGEGSYYFDDFVVTTPDTSEGNISEGSDVTPGNSSFFVEADGMYDIYVNNVGEVYIVYHALGSYPSSSIENFLLNTDDDFLSFETQYAASYTFENNTDYGLLTINLEDNTHKDDLVNEFEMSLKQNYGFGLKFHDQYAGYVLVSPDREIGFNIEADLSEPVILIYFFNFCNGVLNPEFTRDIVLRCENNWDVFVDDAELYAFVMGGTYGGGEFILLTVLDQDEKLFSLDGIDDSAVSINIVRFVDEDNPGWDSLKWYNQTDDINIRSNAEEVTFTLHDRNP